MVIAFDFDGPINYASDVVVAFYQEAHKRFGTPNVKTLDDIAPFYDGNIFEFLREHGLSDSAIKDYMLLARTVFQEHDAQMAVYPGMACVLHRLSKKHDLVIVSSNDETFIKQKLKRSNLESCFSKVLGEQSGQSKRSKIASLQSVFHQPNMYFVTDTTGDVREGNACGARTIGVTWGYHSKEFLQRAKPTRIAETPIELLKILNEK